MTVLHILYLFTHQMSPNSICTIYLLYSTTTRLRPSCPTGAHLLDAKGIQNYHVSGPNPWWFPTRLSREYSQDPKRHPHLRRHIYPLKTHSLPTTPDSLPLDPPTPTNQQINNHLTTNPSSQPPSHRRHVQAPQLKGRSWALSGFAQIRPVVDLGVQHWLYALLAFDIVLVFLLSGY